MAAQAQRGVFVHNLILGHDCARQGEKDEYFAEIHMAILLSEQQFAQIGELLRPGHPGMAQVKETLMTALADFHGGKAKIPPVAACLVGCLG